MTHFRKIGAARQQPQPIRAQVEKNKLIQFNFEINILRYGIPEPMKFLCEANLKSCLVRNCYRSAEGFARFGAIIIKLIKKKNQVVLSSEIY